MRHAFLPGSTATAAEPLMVHFNYHPDKHIRMLCIIDRYFKVRLESDGGGGGIHTYATGITRTSTPACCASSTGTSR